MKRNRTSESGLFTPRIFLAFLICSVGVALGMFSLIGPASSNTAIATVATRFESAPAAQGDVDAMPPFVRQPIEATLQWIASFETRGSPRRSLARRSAASSGIGSQGIPMPRLVVGEWVNATVSPAARDLPPGNAFSAWIEGREEGQLSNRTPQLPRNPLEHDPVVQTTTALTVGMPAVGASFEGINISQACEQCLPPDPNGAVGPNHYVQMVNSNFQVYDKATAAPLLPTKPCAINPANQCAPYINSLWMLTPNSECFTHNNGDPIVIYDQLADRWLISQFVVQASGSPDKYAQCIAISTTPDPTGSYYLYEFDESADTFHDYPHIGVWPNGYYMSTNLFPNSALLTSTGAGAWAFERPKMLLGQPARYVFFDETPLATQTYTPGGQLPTSLDGRNPPPAGAPNYFVEVDDTNTPNTPPATGLHDEMHIWKFQVDWTNPANSTFGTSSTAPALKPGFPGQYAGNAGQPNFIIPIADFLRSACQIENGPNDCTPQPVTSGQPPQYLDVLGDRLMHRVTYRNFGNYESLLVSHTVDAQADQPMGVARNGVRWYELRSVGTAPTVYQQGTFAPFDPTSTNGPLWRWMGSAAMDHSGDIAIGYSASGPNYFPSLHYAGRLGSDLPNGQLTQGEAVMFLGQGIEANTGIFPFRNRWGDYSALQVDPTDDCTFWYTNEYLVSAVTDVLPVNWHTRIGSFKFSQCVSQPPPLSRVDSVKTHGSAGQLPVPLQKDATTHPRGVECRSAGANNSHTILFTFQNNLVGTIGTDPGSASIVSGPGSVVLGTGTVTGIGPLQNQYTVNLTGVTDANYVTVALHNVADTANNFGDVGTTMGVLLGDVTANGVVTNTDVSVVKGQVNPLTLVTQANCREDVTVNGFVTNTDVSVVKGQVNPLGGIPTP